MKLRYWRRGADAPRRNGSVWLALPGLAGSFVLGFFVLVPRFEATVAAGAGRVAEPAVAAPSQSPSPSPIVAEPEQSEQPERPQSVAAARPAAEPAADLCHEAMLAALGNARIEFLTASAEIIPASRNVVSVLAALAHTCPGKIVVDGHSDDLGPEIVNEQISLDRARSVVAAFEEFGIDPQRLEARGFGSSRPIADNTTTQGRARNRRIEMSLIEDSEPQESGEEG